MDPLFRQRHGDTVHYRVVLLRSIYVRRSEKGRGVDGLGSDSLKRVLDPDLDSSSGPKCGSGSVLVWI